MRNALLNSLFYAVHIQAHKKYRIFTQITQAHPRYFNPILVSFIYNIKRKKNQNSTKPQQNDRAVHLVCRQVNDIYPQPWYKAYIATPYHAISMNKRSIALLCIRSLEKKGFFFLVFSLHSFFAWVFSTFYLVFRRTAIFVFEISTVKYV